MRRLASYVLVAVLAIAADRWLSEAWEGDFSTE